MLYFQPLSSIYIIKKLAHGVSKTIFFIVMLSPVFIELE